MKFVQQPYTIRVKNMDDKTQGVCEKACRHGKMLPNTIRGIICGPSNCGKTNVMISLLESPNGVRFENVYVYSKSLNQPKYRYLERLLGSIDEIGYFTFSDNNTIVPHSEALPNSVFVFDDIACDKQNAIREYFAMGRHSKVDCFYLCQTYAKIPKHLVRDNANLLVIFKQDGTNLKHVYNDHVNTDMTYEDFGTLCHACWQHKYGFLVIDKDSAINDGRYRRGFNEFAVPRNG